MEVILDQALTDLKLAITYILAITALGFLFIIFFTERHDIRVGLKGKDFAWQFLELTGVVWLVMFPLLIISSLLGNHADREAWNALEIIFGIGVAGKGYYKYVDKPKNKEEVKETPKEPE